MDYIDQHREEFGVEPICKVLQFAPSTYYASKKRPPSARALRDAVLLPLILTIWTANYEVYRIRKVWKALARAGEDIGRDQVARLMRELGIQGARRGRKFRTPAPIRRLGGIPIWSTASSSPSDPTSCGSPTSRVWRRGRGWSTCASSPTRSRG